MRRVVALTGATGFIGRRLAAHLIARGDEVRAIVRPNSPRPPPEGAGVVRTSLAADALRSAFAGADVVVHLAAVISAAHERTFTAVNVDGTRAAACAARDAGARFVHVSSLAAAGTAPAGAPRVEDDPPAPINAYGRSKLLSERQVQDTTDLRWIILRPGVVYGPGDRALLPLFRFARRGLLPLVGRRGAAFTFVYIDDLCRAITAAIDTRGDGLTCFVGYAAPVTVPRLIGALRTSAGRASLVVPIPAAIVYPAAVVCDLAGRAIGRTLPLNLRRYAEMYAEGFVCRVERLRDRLGIEAVVDLDEGIRTTAAWYRECGWL